MHILISNDDGIYSPGLLALAQAAAAFGTVRVVAPDVERSSAGQSITASRPLVYKRTRLPGLGEEIEAYRVDGTPADCVALGCSQWGKVDVVLSGINLGSNLGNSLWHSGTLAAARQAVLLGVRGIALSAPVRGPRRDDAPLSEAGAGSAAEAALSEPDEPDFAALRPAVDDVLRRLLPDRRLCLVNVNFPAQAPRGLRWTRLSVRHYDGRVVPGRDPQGRPHFWFTVAPLEPAEDGTDRRAVADGYVALTPLRLDLTDEALLAQAAG